jgi:hypothetical protein
MTVNISNKVAQEKLAADFLIQCLSTIGCKNLYLDLSRFLYIVLT